MKLDHDDWQVLAEAPAAVFSLVALADGHVAESERRALVEVWVPKLARLQLSARPAEQEVYRWMMQQRCQQLLEDRRLMTPSQSRQCLGELGRILDERLTDEEGSFLRNALVSLARDIAKSAASFFGLGVAVSDEERSAIQEIGHLLTRS